MFGYAAKRILGAVPTLFILAALTFFLVRLAPGSPFDTDVVWPKEIKENILRVYELDRPAYVQFSHWVRDLSRGDLRESFQYIGRPVTAVIRESLPYSFVLGVLSLALAVVVGVPLGCLAAIKRGTFWDTSSMFVSVAGISLPSYLVASILILVFAVKLHWFPPALWEGPTSLVLPVATLASRPIAIIAKLTRASLIESMNQDYIRTAFGKGLSNTEVVFKHALKNSVIPIITVLGPLAASLVTGSFLVEEVFQIPGLGMHFVQGVLNRDYPLVMGLTLIYGTLLILSNILVDLACGWADPRIRLGSRLE
jgi:oligopeptide transport system permease protein